MCALVSVHTPETPRPVHTPEIGGGGGPCSRHPVKGAAVEGLPNWAKARKKCRGGGLGGADRVGGTRENTGDVILDSDDVTELSGDRCAKPDSRAHDPV